MRAAHNASLCTALINVSKKEKQSKKKRPVLGLYNCKVAYSEVCTYTPKYDIDYKLEICPFFALVSAVSYVQQIPQIPEVFLR